MCWANWRSTDICNCTRIQTSSVLQLRGFCFVLSFGGIICPKVCQQCSLWSLHDYCFLHTLFQPKYHICSLYGTNIFSVIVLKNYWSIKYLTKPHWKYQRGLKIEGELKCCRVLQPSDMSTHLPRLRQFQRVSQSWKNKQATWSTRTLFPSAARLIKCLKLP